MRAVIIAIVAISVLSLTAYPSTASLGELKSIRSQFTNSELSMERHFQGELKFKDDELDSDLGNIYEYKTKSPFKAFMLSLAVPGAGEFYLDQKIKAGSFLLIDAALWTSYFVYRGKGNDKENEYKQYADEHYIWNTYITWWDMQDSATQSNFSHRMPFDSVANQPIFNHEYYENIGKYHQFQVGWDDIGINIPPSDTGGYVSPHRAFYLDLRKKSNDYFNTATTLAMVSIANHIVSAFDAAIAAKKFKKGAKQYSLKMKAKQYNGHTIPFVVFTAKF